MSELKTSKTQKETTGTKVIPYGQILCKIYSLEGSSSSTVYNVSTGVKFMSMSVWLNMVDISLRGYGKKAKQEFLFINETKAAGNPIFAELQTSRQIFFTELFINS